MEKIIEKCSVCGNYTEGTPTYSNDRKFVQKGTSAITTKIVGAIIGAIIGFLFGGIGSIPGMIIGIIVATFISPKVTEEIDKTLYKTTTYTFTCLGCGKTWYKIIKNGTNICVPDHILQKEKDETVAKYNKKASKHVRRLIVACLIFVVGLIIFINCDHSYTETFWGIKEYSNTYLFSLFFMEISFPGIVYELIKYFSNKNKANKYQQMSLSDFVKNKKL